MGGDIFDRKGLTIHDYRFGDGLREGPGGSDGNRGLPHGCSHDCVPFFMHPDASAVELEKVHRCVGDPLQDLVELDGTHQESADLFQFLRFERTLL